MEAVRESDAILREEFQLAGLDKKVWQYFTVVPDFKSVGVRDNARSFDWPVIIRAVNTVDAMTATIEPVDWPILMKITDRILKEVKTVNRVCYDMSPKPNATIEWELRLTNDNDSLTLKRWGCFYNKTTKNRTMKLLCMIAVFLCIPG